QARCRVTAFVELPGVPIRQKDERLLWERKEHPLQRPMGRIALSTPLPEARPKPTRRTPQGRAAVTLICTTRTAASQRKNRRRPQAPSWTTPTCLPLRDGGEHVAGNASRRAELRISPSVPSPVASLVRRRYVFRPSRCDGFTSSGPPAAG